MQKDISPEEKLLSIIRGKQDKAAGKDTGENGTKDDKTKTAASQSKIDSYLSNFLKNSFLKNTVFEPHILKMFDKYMVVVVGLLMLYLFANIFFVSPSRKAALIISRMSIPAVSAPLTKIAAPIETKGYAYYYNRISGKRIFTGSYTSSAQEGMESSGEPSSDDIGLLGIIKGNNPQAIIEDKKSQKTYYLIKGQSANGIIIEDISEDKVMLDYKGKRMTLFL